MLDQHINRGEAEDAETRITCIEKENRSSRGQSRAHSH